jgi:hypothetical protein
LTPHVAILGDRKYQLVSDHVVSWYHEGKYHRIMVPEGFICDGNSVPWFGRPFIPGDWTLGINAVLVHDFLYFRRGRLLFNEHLVQVAKGDYRDPLEQDGYRLAWSRRDADRLFARLMRDNNVPQWRRRAAYRAVRLAFWQEWPDSAWRDDNEP